MSKDITEKKHQNIADGAEGVQVQVAPLDKVLDAVAAKEPKNFNLHQVFDKDDEEEVDEQLFGEIFDEALEYEMSDELIQRNELVKATVQMDMVGKTRDEVHGLVGCSRAC